MFESVQDLCPGLNDASYEIDEEYYLLNVDDIPPLDLELNIKICENEPQAGTSAELTATKKEDKIKQKKKGGRKRTKQSVPSSSAIPLPQIDITWENYNWQCQYCELYFPTVSELKIHGIKNHECCNPYKCTDCNIRKAKLDCFVTHVTTHKKYLKFSCYICNEKFFEIKQAKLHCKLHLKTKYTCSGCNESFATPDELDEHNLTYKRDTQSKKVSRASLNENLRCHVCSKTFKHKRTLSSHILKHSGKKQEHKCEKCGKTYVTKQGLNGHMMTHDNIRPFRCVICNFKFRTMGQLRMHVGVHNEEKPYECEVCGKKFRLEKQLISHQIIHTNLYPYSCHYCEKKFRFKSFIREHIRQHTGVKPYCCMVCKKRFANWANYNKHMKFHHSINVAKRKWTSKGICPIDPETGQVIMWEETEETNEWKKEILSGHRKPGRPKTKQ